MLPITFQPENSKPEGKLNFKLTKLNCCLWQSTKMEITIPIVRAGWKSIKSHAVRLHSPENQMPGQGSILWKFKLRIFSLNAWKSFTWCLVEARISGGGMIHHGTSWGNYRRDAVLTQLDRYVHFCLISFCAKGIFSKTKNIMLGYYTEWSQKEKNKYCILKHVYGIQKDGTDEPTCRAAMEMQT